MTALEGNGVYLVAAFVLTLAVLGGYLFSLVSRMRDAQRDLRRQDPDTDPG